MIADIELLEPSVARLTKERFRAMTFLELLISSSSGMAEAMVVKENGALVAVSAFHVWDCSGQAKSYIYDPVSLAGHEVSHLHKNSDSARNSHCPTFRHYFEKRVSLLI